MRTALILGALTALNAGLAGAGWWMLETPVETVPIPAGRDGNDLLGNDGGRGGGAALDFSGLTQVQAFARPLFSPDRRPLGAASASPAPAEEEVAEKKPAPKQVKPPLFTLVGVSVANGGAPRALISLNATRTLWAEEGQVLGRWVVKKIGPQSVELVLRGGSDTLSMSLYPDLAGTQ